LAIIQSLSLDVALGVLCSGAYAASATGAQPPWVWWALLPATTWAIYSVDHLRDGRLLGSGTRDFRHLFCFQHRWKVSAVTLVISIACALTALLFLEVRLWLVGGLLAILAWVHLRFPVRGRLLPKELTAAAIYTAGIWFVPIMGAAELDPWIWALVGLHFLAALANLVVFSLFALPVDHCDGQASIVRSYGARRVRHALGWVTVVGAIAALALMNLGPARYLDHAVVVLLLVIIPGLMDVFRSKLVIHGRFRTLGDLSFVIMAIPWFMR